MTASPSQKPERPLSPHLQIYRPQLTSGMSIFHRITGIALSVGLPVFVAWLVALARGPDTYASFIGLFHNWFGQLLLIGWAFSFFYHLCCGIRHLFWDAGIGLNIKAVYISGYIAIAVALFMTVCTLLTAYGVVQ